MSKDADTGKVDKSPLIARFGQCLLCARADISPQLLCPACEQDLPTLTGACPSCARPLMEGRFCGRCLHAPPPLTRVFSPFVYAFPLDRIIQQMKFRGVPTLARDLGHIMARRMDRGPELGDSVLVPVPLHPLRQFQRGFNQARILAESLARDLGMAMDSGCCRRRRYTLPQASLNQSDRARNLKNAFYIKKIPDKDRVILIDDVMTTGHTLHALARELLARGVPRVDAWILARTPDPGTYQ